MILIDTNILIWILQSSQRLNKKSREFLEQSHNIHFSPITLFEIAILNSLNRLKPHYPASAYRKLAHESGFFELPLSSEIFDLYETLPLHHKDPHDRLLIAQAKHHDLTLVTADPWFDQYDIKIEKI
jgi:PIN domain nuclease of toxin-antitoxin system